MPNRTKIKIYTIHTCLRLIVSLYSFLITFSLQCQNIDQELENPVSSVLKEDSLSQKQSFYELKKLELIDTKIAIDSFDIASKHLSDLMQHFNYQVNNPRKALFLFNRYFPKIKTEISQKSLAQLYIDLARSYDYSENTAKSLEYNNLAIDIAEKQNFTILLGNALLNKSKILSEQGFFTEALAGYQKADSIYKTTKDTTDILAVQHGQSKLFSLSNLLREAQEIRDESILLACATKNYERLTSLYLDSAKDAKKIGDTLNALYLLKKALRASYSAKRTVFFKQHVFKELAVIYSQLDSISLGRSLLDSLSHYKNENSLIIDIDNYYYAKKHVLFKEGKYQTAQKVASQYLNFVKERKSFDEMKDAQLFLSKVYEKMGYTNKAYIHFKKYTTLKDSIVNIQNISSLLYYQNLYKTEKSNAEIKSQRNAIAILQIQNRIKNQWILFGSIVIMVIFGFLWFAKSIRIAKKSKIQQEVFFKELRTAEEKERTRIAREIHDSIGGNLAAIKLQLNNINSNSIAKDLKTISSDIDDTYKQVRDLSHNLMPKKLNVNDFCDVLEEYLSNIGKSSGLHTSFSAYPIEKINALEETTRIEIFKIIQELITNTIKHAKAKVVSLSLNLVDTSINILFEDDGKGFDTSVMTKGIGLQNIENRIQRINGTIHIDSKINRGTLVNLEIDI